MINRVALVTDYKKPRQADFWLDDAVTEARFFGEFSKAAVGRWKRQRKSKSIKHANEQLQELKKLFKFGGFNIRHASDDDLVKEYASVVAIRCVRLCESVNSRSGQYSDGLVRHTDALLEYLAYHDIGGDQFWRMVKRMGLRSMFARLCDVSWWRRRIRRACARATEHIAKTLGMINKQRSIYVSAAGRRGWLCRRESNIEYMKGVSLENQYGQRYTMHELSQLSTSNPELRRNELMTRIAGFEMLAKEQKKIGMFYTITCPSRFHSHYTNGGYNPKYDGASPRDAQEYLNWRWSLFRAAADRGGWDYYGFRVSEPHHDGTPHWHLILFVDREHEQALTKKLCHYACEIDRHEISGRTSVRFKAIRIKDGINHKTGKSYSAAGYVAKYISKNIDGHGVDDDGYGRDAKDSAVSITAWASRNGIRQFQQVGGAPVTGWRELRRLAVASDEHRDGADESLLAVADEMQKICDQEKQGAAAEAWAFYCRVCSERGKFSLVKVEKMIDELIEDIDTKTGEVFMRVMKRHAMNAYNELLEKIHGIELNLGTAKTRFFDWVKVSNDGVLDDAQASPWTGLNNCTKRDSARKSEEPPPLIAAVDRILGGEMGVMCGT